MAKHANRQDDKTKKVAGELRKSWPSEDMLGWDRDAKLKSLLPTLDSPYDFKLLSEAETHALEAAFSDGFGSVTGKDAKPLPLPRGINTGLLKHEFHLKSLLEDEEEDSAEAFWEIDSETELAPSDELPIRFIKRRLRMYFENQVDRFCHKMISEDPSLAKCEKSLVEDFALDRFYEKPWYEIHAIQVFEQFDELLKAAPRLKCGTGFAFLTSCYTGEAGRLIEQYYWRFRYEGAAIIGLRARKGASSGGISKAVLHRSEHAQWQKAASEIWERRPQLTTTAVAETIKKRLCVPRTAKHIARYIKPPSI